MKKLIVLLIAVSVTHLGLAQKCKWTINKKDPFTGEQTNAIVHYNSGVTWTSMKRGDKLLVEFTFLHAGDVQKPMLSTDSILVKLADGTVLHLKPSSDVPPFNQSKSVSKGGTSVSGRYNSSVTSTMDVTSFSPLFILDRGAYELLSKSAVQAIRIDFTGKPLDFDFMSKPLVKSVDDIMNNSKCILLLN